MIVAFFINLSPKNKIDKSLNYLKNIECVLKDPTNIETPSINLTIDEYDYILKNSNYILLNELGRFYFITDVIYNSNNLVTINLECDVLYTFKRDILTSYAYVTKNVRYNEYYNDGSYQSLETKQNSNYKFSSQPFDFSSTDIVLVTIGGV